MIPFGDKTGTVSGGTGEADSIGPADSTAAPVLIVIVAGNAKLPTPAMKIATWNVNGIRARQGEVQQWIERERPDVVCLQEIKATSDQLPAALCEMEDYWCYWHGGQGDSGVGPPLKQTIAPPSPPHSPH